MDELPDISSLYQRKYLSKHPLNYSSRPSPEIKINNRYELFTQRFASSMDKYPTPVEKHTMKCIKIVKTHTDQNRLDQTQASKITANRLEAWAPVNISQSTDMGRKRSLLTRQLLRLSGQKEGDLEEGLQFGQKNLLSMFQTFFQQRHRTNQRRRQESRSHHFQPIRNVAKQPIAKPEHPKLVPSNYKKRKISPAIVPKEKELEPWDFQESDVI